MINLLFFHPMNKWQQLGRQSELCLVSSEIVIGDGGVDHDSISTLDRMAIGISFGTVVLLKQLPIVAVVIFTVGSD